MRLHLRARLVGHIAALGFSSSFVVELSGGLVLLVLNLVILAFEGTIGVAAYGVVANFAFVASGLFVGIAQASSRWPATRTRVAATATCARVLRLALLTALVIATTTYAAVALAAEPLALAFNRDNDPQLTALAVDGMRVYFLGYFFAGGEHRGGGVLQRGGEAGVWPGYLHRARSSAMLAFAAVLAALFGMAGVWPRSPRPRRPRSR